MLENGQIKAAAPECKGQLGWVYHNGACYMFTSYHADYLEAEESCNEVGGYNLHQVGKSILQFL